VKGGPYRTDLSISLMKQKSVITHNTQLYRREKKLDTFLIDLYICYVFMKT